MTRLEQQDLILLLGEHAREGRSRVRPSLLALAAVAIGVVAWSLLHY